MAGTNASAIRDVHCRPQVLTVFRSCVVGELLPALYECWLLSRVVVERCCGGLPPPGKGPSPAVWGEGLYRTSLDAGGRLQSLASRVGALQEKNRLGLTRLDRRSVRG